MSLQIELKTVFDYKNGYLYRKGSKEPSGWIDKDGYYLVSFQSKTYRANRLIWIYHHGETEEKIDHKDQDRQNNKIENLRPATDSQNNQNRKIHADNKTGYKGVVENTNGTFTAYADENGMTKNLGTRSTAKEASGLYEEFTTKLHGEFKSAT